MDVSYLPQEPEKRRAILVLSSAEIERIRFDQKYKKWRDELLQNEQVCLLEDSFMGNNSLIQKLKNDQLLNSETLLIQNPYDPSVYKKASKEVAQTFYLLKWNYFTTLCKLLGAREVFIEENKKVESESILSFLFEVISGWGRSDAAKTAKARIISTLEKKSTFPGGTPDIKAAWAYLEKCQLKNDSDMASLIEQRDGDNPLTSSEVNLSLSKECQSNLKIASSLKVPQIYTDMQAQIEQIKKESYEFTLKIKVNF